MSLTWDTHLFTFSLPARVQSSTELELYILDALFQVSYNIVKKREGEAGNVGTNGWASNGRLVCTNTQAESRTFKIQRRTRDKCDTVEG